MKETKRDVRITWIGFTVVFTVIGTLLLYRGRASYPYFYGAAVFFAFFAAAAPMALLPFYRVWVKFAKGLAWVNTRLLLGVVFFAIITPMGLAMRAMGKDPLEKKIDRGAATYWAKREKRVDEASYDKQY